MRRRDMWWGTAKDLLRRQDAAARPEPTDDLPTDEPMLAYRQRPGRKNTRTWCKGKVGRQHTLAIAIPANTAGSPAPCGWREDQRLVSDSIHATHYACLHVELCTECGKVFRPYYPWIDAKSYQSYLRPQECPLFTPRNA